MQAVSTGGTKCESYQECVDLLADDGNAGLMHWLAAHPEQRAGLLDVRTVVRRGVESGDFRVAVDPVRNHAGEAVISAAGSRVDVLVLATDEERAVAEQIAIYSPHTALDAVLRAFAVNRTGE